MEREGRRFIIEDSMDEVKVADKGFQIFWWETKYSCVRKEEKTTANWLPEAERKHYLRRQISH